MADRLRHGLRYLTGWVMLALLGVWLAFAAPAGAQSATAQSAATPLADYWQLVDDTHALVRRADAAAQTELAAIADRWEAIAQVTLPDGTLVPVDHTVLVNELRAAAPDFDALGARLSALQDLRGAWPAGPFGEAEADGAVARLNEILSRPAFQWQPDEPSLLDRLWERILRFLVNLLPEGAAPNAVNVLLASAGAIALILVLVLALRSLLAGVAEEAGGNENGAGSDADLTADSALKRAQELSRGGDYRTAVRYLYLSTLLLLDERGLLRYDRSRTNRETLRSIADRPELATTLRHVVDVFDRVWYGYQPLSATEYAEYEAKVDALKRQK